MSGVAVVQECPLEGPLEGGRKKVGGRSLRLRRLDWAQSKKEWRRIRQPRGLDVIERRGRDPWKKRFPGGGMVEALRSCGSSFKEERKF